MIKMIWVTAVMMVLAGCGENSHQVSQKSDAIIQARQAGSEGDYISAVFYLREAIKSDSSQEGWMDTLAQYYMQLNLSKAAESTIEKYLSRFPAKEGILKTQARLFEAKGIPDSIIHTYDQLFLLTQKDKYLYYKAFYEWYGGDPKLAQQHVDALASKKELAEDSVEVSIPSQGYFQMVKLKAAVYHLKTDIDLAQGKIAEAKKDLQAALQSDPGFGLAQEALKNFDRLVAMKRAQGGQ